MSQTRIDDILEYSSQMHNHELHLFTDPPTGLEVVIAIYNTKLGPALGGCRWLEYPNTLDAIVDATRLGQGMAYKTALAGLALGGGKAVLLKPKKEINLKKYFKAFGRCVESLGGRYITAVDAGTSTEIMDIIATETSHVCSTSKTNYSSADPSPITAVGVQRGIEAAVKFKFQQETLKDLHVVVSGLGHVGGPLVHSLVAAGAKVSVSDINSALVEKYVKELGVTAIEKPEDALITTCDIYCPCALGAILNKQSIAKMKAKIVVGSANNQLQEPQDADRLAAKGIVYAPDFVVNAGGIIYVSGEYKKQTEAETMQQVNHIYNTTLHLLQVAEESGTTAYRVAHEIAVEKMQGED